MTDVVNDHDNDDGFTPVTYKATNTATRKGGKKNRKPKYRERTLEEKLAQRLVALERSKYLDECTQLVRESIANRSTSSSSCPPPRCVVCLGLGSVSDSTKAQDQYLLLDELLIELKPFLDPEEPVQFYDPVFTPEDKEFLTSRGHSVLSTDFELELNRPTFLYIPHGPRSLFTALLERNWTSSKIRNVVIFGNRLDLYDDPTYSGSSITTTTSTSQQPQSGGGGGGIETIRRAAEWLFEIRPLPKTKEHLEAFNDLAIEWVDRHKLERAIDQGRIPNDHDDREEEEEIKQRSNKPEEGDGIVEALDSLNLAAR